MKYFVKIDGGFSGIPKTYEGEIDTGRGEASRLMRLLGDTIRAENPDLRDAFNYKITLYDRGKAASGSYNDAQLPMELRKFLDRIKRDDKK
jgi:hypothetical protein